MAGRSTMNPPASYVVSGTWPQAELSGPRIVHYAQLFAARVSEAIDGRTIREVARRAELSHATLLGVLLGDRWPDMVTIAKLEEGLNADLWPGVEVRRVLGPSRVQPRLIRGE